MSSVVVVAHRPHRWLPACLQSVRGQCDEVIVVDNGSPGDAVARVARDHGARLVPLARNLGFPAGVNAGVAASTGDVVALLNDDAMAEPGWLDSAATVLGDDGVAAVAPKLVFALPFAEVRFPDPARQVGADTRPLGRALRTATIAGNDVLDRLVGPGVHLAETGVLDGVAGPWRWTSGPGPIYLALEPDWDPADLRIDGEAAPVVGQARLINNAGSYLSDQGHAGDHGYLSPDDGRFDVGAERFGGCGAALVTTARVLARVGPLAAEFFAYYEDVDWCWRARLSGLRVRYEPAGVVRHVGGVTTGGPRSIDVRRLAARNRLLCLARNAPFRVVAEQTRRAFTADPVPGFRARAAPRLAAAVLRRPGSTRRWSRSRQEVWDEWAGRDQTWSTGEG